MITSAKHLKGFIPLVFIMFKPLHPHDEQCLEPSCYPLGPKLKCIAHASHSWSFWNSVPTSTELEYSVPLVSGVNYIYNSNDYFYEDNMYRTINRFETHHMISLTEALALDDILGRLLNPIKVGRSRRGNPWVAVLVSWIIIQVRSTQVTSLFPHFPPCFHSTYYFK